MGGHTLISMYLRANSTCYEVPLQKSDGHPDSRPGASYESGGEATATEGACLPTQPMPHLVTISK